MDFCERINQGVNFLVRIVAAAFQNEHQLTKKYLAYWNTLISVSFFGLMTVIFLYTVFGVIIPFELSVAESYLFVYFRVFLSLWAFYNVFFHYYMAITVKPFNNPGVPTKNICEKCQHWKSKFTFHCKSCDRCIWKRDHHCPWIGQCVGAHNQSHFFLFLLHFYIGTVLFLVFAPTFWIDHFSNFSISNGVNVGTLYTEILLNKIRYILGQAVICKHGYLPSLIFGILVFLHFFFLSFIWAYVFLVTGVKTIIRNCIYGKKLDENGKPIDMSFRMIKLRWRAFLGMREHSGSVLGRIFIPVPKHIEYWI